MGILNRDKDTPEGESLDGVLDPVEESIRWEGLAQLRPFIVPLATLHPHERNPRKGNVQMISESLLKFGQMEPILVDDGKAILAGNHRYLAARSIGWTHIAVLSAADLPERTGLAYMVAANRSSDLASYDEDLLAEALRELSDEGELDGTGWSQDEFDELYAASPLAEEAANVEIPEVENGDPLDPAPLPGASGNPEGLKPFTIFLAPETFPDFVKMVEHLQEPFGIFKRDDIIVEAVKRAAELEGYGG